MSLRRHAIVSNLEQLGADNILDVGNEHGTRIRVRVVSCFAMMSGIQTWINHAFLHLPANESAIPNVNSFLPCKQESNLTMTPASMECYPSGPAHCRAINSVRNLAMFSSRFSCCISPLSMDPFIEEIKNGNIHRHRGSRQHIPKLVCLLQEKNLTCRRSF